MLINFPFFARLELEIIVDAASNTPQSNSSINSQSPLCCTPQGTVPKDLTAQVVRGLRLVLATFQETDLSVVFVSQLAGIVKLMDESPLDISVLRSSLPALSNGNTSATRVIDFKKFLRFFVYYLHGGHLPVRSCEIYKAFDHISDGQVTAEELQESLTGMGMSLNGEEALAGEMRDNEGINDQ